MNSNKNRPDGDYWRRAQRDFLLNVIGIALILFAAVGAAVFLASDAPEGTTTTQAPATVTTTAPCQEDEPCFDCRTMGNRSCGMPEVDMSVLCAAPIVCTWDDRGGLTLTDPANGAGWYMEPGTIVP